MGEEIKTTDFAPEDFARFARSLAEETRLARAMADRSAFSDDGYTIGFEVECWLLDHNYFPHPINERFLKTLNHDYVVPELSRFNVEFNCTPQTMTGGALSTVTREMTELWAYCNEIAHSLDANMVMIGTLPTIRDEDLSLANMSPMKRYYALNNEVLRRRGGVPITLDIEGRERLSTRHGDVMLEAATTSFQIHLKTPISLSHRYWNVSAMISGPMMAASVNAPFLFGRAVWDETRIPLFEQSVQLSGKNAGVNRVSFGRGYLRTSPIESFEENLSEYPVLLPISFDEPAEQLRHLRLHNGTIWRWNRPLVGFESDGTPHVRLEHRILPAGPTFLDMMANAALYLGLSRALVDAEFDLAALLSFDEAKRNFYAAARHGLAARLAWPGKGEIAAQDLLTEELIPLARKGLNAFGIDAADRDLFLDIIAARVASGQTGAEWQRKAHAAYDGDVFKLMAVYCERQRSGAPVHQWDV